MDRSWYVRHRPQIIDEIDEEEVRKAVLLFVKRGKFPHALLFTGPKGTGKTSTARIIAKILNCEKTVNKLGEPCNSCSICREITNGNSMCVVEVDAASHRGIDDVRALRETVKLMPAGGRTKVYIIDEAHMLTTEAANALLKTLEEPPDNVVFILATTDAQKIPETIKSRATLIQFKRATKEELARSLSRVIKSEKLDIDKKALDSIISGVEGSFRDATKILEQLSSSGKITKESVDRFFSTNVVEPVAFLTLVSEKDSKAILSEVESIISKGVNPRQFTVQLIETLHLQLLARVGVGENEKEIPFQLDEMKNLIELLTRAAEEMKSAPVAQLPLELAMIEWCGGGGEEVSDAIHFSRNSIPEKEKVEVRSGNVDGEAGSEKEQKSNFPSPSEAIPVSHLQPLTSISDETWKQLLTKVKTHNFSLEALLRAARPLSFDGQDVTVSVFYKFHKDKLEEENHRRVLEQILCELLGAKTVRLFFVLGEKPKTVIADDAVIISEQKETTEVEDITKVAEEIFGGKLHD